MNYINVNDDITFFLYGDNDRCKKIIKYMRICNIKVGGVIDKKYVVKQNRDNLVYSNYEDFVEESNGMKTSIAIIICLWNATLHDEIAYLLSKDGYNAVVFVPMKTELYSYEYIRKIRESFLAINNGQLMQLRRIPLFTIDKTNVIRSYKDVIEFWCPVDYIFSSTKQMDIEQWGGFADGNNYFWSDILLRDCEPYLELLNWYYGCESDIMKYIRYKDVNRLGTMEDDEIESFLSNRKELIDKYIYSLKYDSSFFIDSPIEVVYSSSLHFNVVDGMHRAIFLLYSGFEKVPTICSVLEYERYIEDYNERRGEICYTEEKK